MSMCNVYFLQNNIHGTVGTKTELGLIYVGTKFSFNVIIVNESLYVPDVIDELSYGRWAFWVVNLDYIVGIYVVDMSNLPSIMNHTKWYMLFLI